MSEDNNDTYADETADDKQVSSGLFKRVQEQLTGFTGSAIDSVPLKLMLSAVGEGGWLKHLYVNPLEPSRLQAMADAGEFLREARELAGMSVNDVATAIGLKDKDLLADVERGESTLSFDMLFRVASLLARHDPLPFIIKFARTYSPAVDAGLEKLGLDVIPKHIERERRFINIYRSHDKLRQLSDEEYDRFCAYIAHAADFIMEVMETEKSIARRIEIDEADGVSGQDTE